MNKYTMLEMGLKNQCAHIHVEIKLLIPEADAQQLIKAGFVDCSYGNDECPSYYNPQSEADVQIYAVDDLNDDYERVSDNISYMISHNARPCATIYESVADAIAVCGSLDNAKD